MKVARFAQVVDHSGTPQIHLAWSAPAHDPVLRQALKQHRLMTVHQRTRGARKDHAVVGLEPGHDTQYLIFPKSLRRFQDQRIVGIQYGLLGDALSIQPTRAGRKRARGSAGSLRRKASRHDNVVPFAAVSPVKPRASAKKEKAQEPVVPAAISDDPILREVHLALQELRGGHQRRAEQRLKTLLKQ